MFEKLIIQAHLVECVPHPDLVVLLKCWIENIVLRETPFVGPAMDSQGVLFSGWSLKLVHHASEGQAAR